MPKPDILRPTGQAESSPQAKYETSKKAYFAVLNDPTSDPGLMEKRFSPLKNAYYSIDGLSLDSKTTTLTIFARTGMIEARRRGRHDIADSLGKQVQTLEDNLAIAKGEYDYLGSREGAPDAMTSERPETFTYRAPDGRVIERSKPERDAILVLKAGHSPNGYSFTRTGVVIPTLLEPFTRPVAPHADAEVAAALLFD